MQNMCPAHKFGDEITIYFIFVKKEKISVLYSRIYVMHFCTFYIGQVQSRFFEKCSAHTWNVQTYTRTFFSEILNI